MKILSIFNNKGGVGKTTSAVNLAAELGRKGNRVLIIDLDPQCNATGYIGGHYPPSEGSYGLLQGEDVSVSLTQYDNLWIIPASINLISLEEETEIDNTTKSRLRDYLYSKDDRFDFVILDCPPSLGLITINALVASDSILIPIKVGKFDLDGFETLFNTVNAVKVDLNPSLEILGVFVTMYRNINFYKQIKDELSGELENLLFNQCISLSAPVVRSTFEGKPVVYLSKNCKAAKEYKALVEELLCRI